MPPTKSPAESNSKDPAAVETQKKPPAPDPSVKKQSVIEQLRKTGATLRFNGANLVGVSFRKVIDNTPDETCALLKHTPTIEWLEFGDSPVTDGGLQHLSELTSLTRLQIKSPKITDAGLVHLVGMTKLEGLNLYNSRISDEGLVLLHGLDNLKELYVLGSLVTVEGARAIEKAIPKLKVFGARK